jgi:hypothetical protein
MNCPKCGSKDTGFRMIERARHTYQGVKYYYGKKYFCRQCHWGEQ